MASNLGERSRNRDPTRDDAWRPSSGFLNLVPWQIPATRGQVRRGITQHIDQLKRLSEPNTASNHLGVAHGRRVSPSPEMKITQPRPEPPHTTRHKIGIPFEIRRLL
jgi:hypothetical protein